MVARLITPMIRLCARPEKERVEKTGRIMKAYLKTVGWTLRHRWITLGTTLLLFVASLTLVKLLPTTFIPENDIDQTRVGIELTPDASLQDTSRITKMVEDRVSQIEGVKSILSVVGDPQQASLDSASSSGSVSNAASVDIVLEPRGTRPSKIRN